MISNRQDLARYRTALGLPIRPVRLTASAKITEARLRRRYSASQQQPLDWHLARHADLSARLEAADLDETTIDTDALAPVQVASTVLTHFGYLADGADGRAPVR